MKRSLAALLLIILATTTTSGAATTKKKARKASKPTTYEAKADTGAAIPGPQIKPERKQSDPDSGTVSKPGPIPFAVPVELQLKRASSRVFDLRTLPQTKPIEQDRAELPEPAIRPVTVQGSVAPPVAGIPAQPTPAVQAPAPIAVYDGLDRFNWGAGSPPDTNGDVGPNNYIQTVNTSIGVYRKSDGFQQAAFTFNTFMSQGSFGNLCDTNNFGDPVVLYDTFEDRWIITDFAFTTDISGNVVSPSFQCFAASKTSDPVAGGWNFYSLQISDALNDYPKFGIWPDGLYMSANMFSFGAGSSFQGFRAWAFNKAQMYAGSPTVKIVAFNLGTGDFTVVPSNARLQTGTPPPGRPNLFISSWNFLNALTVYKFHADWNSLSLSTFTGPDTPTIPVAFPAWPNAAVANAGQPGTAMLLDVLQIRAMVQSQYTNFGGTESLWVPHTVRRANTSGLAAPRWYQVDVTGGTVAANIPQATTWDPDGANVVNRFMPSLALDRAGDMAMGYSVSNAVGSCATTCVDKFPSIMYAGRLAADPINTFSKTEQTFFTGTASQTGINRWGDYSSMTLDPDGCTFWYTSEYANPADQTFNHRWLTKFGSFRFTECTQVGAGGTVSGTVTATVGGAPIAGATVQLGVRSTTTNGSGNYSFLSIPAGTYPTITASAPGFNSSTVTGIVVTDGVTTTQNFSLTAAPSSACATDTTQGDFLTGVPTNVDVNTIPGSVTLLNAPFVDQQNTAGTTTGTSFGTTSWGGQTFIPAVTGSLVKVDVQLFCSGCTGTTPNLTLSVRSTSGGLPTGADLATGTLAGFSSGAGSYYTITLGAPVALTSGTQYALVLRPVAAPSVGGYFWIRASPSSYANGQRVISTDNGVTWSADSTRDFNFKAYMQTGFAASGNFVSSPKDSNAGPGLTPVWTTISWNATVPAPTTLSFQVAASNSINGPFNFVGPDGTAGTFFTTSGASLSQFYGFRYLAYKAFFTTSDGTQTPTLNDVTLCFNDLNCSAAATVTPGAAAACSNSTGNTASGPAGATSYGWSITNGTITSATNIQTITYTAGVSGTVGLTLNIVEAAGCHKTGSANVPISAYPAAPTITPTPASVCANSTGNSAAGPAGATTYAWLITNGTITSATNIQTITYTAGASGTVGLTLTVTNAAGCATPNTANVTINANPATPTITPTPAAVCASSTGNSAAGPAGATTYAWLIANGTITSATNIQTITYTAGASGTVGLTLTVTNASGCPATNTANVTINPNPNATITAPASVVINSTGNTASTANAGAGATYAWSVTGGTLTSGNNTPSITFTAGSTPGTLTINLTVTNSSGCSDAKSANVNRVLPIVTVTSIVPNFGTVTGGTNVTINGTNFAAGATVTLGGTAATNVVVVSAIKITAKTPAHAAGAVNVTVTNTDTSTGTLTNGYTYNPQVFDPNGDGTIDPADIFFLINYLFTGGPAPHGPGGVISGDANGDGVVDPADIFYLINYLFLGGQKPNLPTSITNPRTTAVSKGTPEIAGSLSLGTPVLRDGHYFIPVVMTSRGSVAPQSMSLKIHVNGRTIADATVRRAGAAKDVPTVFETSRRSGNDVSYLVAYDPRGLSFDESRSAVVAEIDVAGAGANLSVSIDPVLTMLGNQAGTIKASVANGKLEVRGISADGDSGPRPRTPEHEVN